MKYFLTFLLNLDATLGGLIYGAPSGMYISTWAKLKKHYRTERFINWLFQDDYHCAKSLHSQMPLVRQYYGG